ncbi:MAG: CrcB family protein [Actinomycetota bacterium]|nr:CrcB family protein [Actinomycetota bacterium]
MASDPQLTEPSPEERCRLLRALDGPRATVRRHVPLAWRRRLAVLIGGCAGSGLRIVVATLPANPAGWPWATFVVNLTGALLLGYLLVRFEQAAPTTVLTIPLLCVGALGSYTTFSALSAETWQLATSGRTGVAAGYAAASMLGGLLAALVAMRLAERRP